SDPQRFISTALDRLHQTMSFAWIAARFTSESRLGPALVGPTLTRGEAPGPAGALDGPAATLMARAAAERSAFIVGDAEEAGLEIDSPLIVQPILREDRPAGILVGGDKRGDDPQISSYDMQLLEASAAYLGAFLENAALYAEQQSMFLG